MTYSINKCPAIFAVVILCGIAVGCQQQSDPVTFSVNIPQPNVVGFQANLTQHYNIGLGGSFDLPNNVGQIILSPESPAQGFGLGFNLNTRAFLKDTWVDFQDVTTLPTGAPFPTWMTGSVADVWSSKLNGNGVDYHFYFGDHNVFYLGVAGVIHAIDERFPVVNIGYTFYDSKGNIVLGFQFFGPKIGPNGKATVPGGIFIGTNISPLLPKPVQASAVHSSALQMQSGELYELVQRISRGQAVTVNGVSVVSDIEVSGRDATHYRSQSEIHGVLNRFFEASRKTY